MNVGAADVDDAAVGHGRIDAGQGKTALAQPL
jgi:hypothetical protein